MTNVIQPVKMGDHVRVVLEGTVRQTPGFRGQGSFDIGADSNYSACPGNTIQSHDPHVKSVEVITPPAPTHIDGKDYYTAPVGTIIKADDDQEPVEYLVRVPGGGWYSTTDETVYHTLDLPRPVVYYPEQVNG